MNNKKFIYFPSFSVGNFTNLDKDGPGEFKNGIPYKFYSPRFPKKFRHPYFLITAGHYYKKENFAEEIGLREADDITVMGDSGGFQIASGAIKWDLKIREKIFKWLENNSDVALNLDIPPRMKYNGKYEECLQLSYDNFKYFSDHQTGNTEFLNILQGTNIRELESWYDKVKDFEFSGWSAGGIAKSPYLFLSAIAVLMENKIQYKDNNKWLHFLGVSRIKDMVILAQCQKSLADLGSDIKVTTDSSTPSRTAAFGNYVYDYNLKRSFSNIHVPNARSIEKKGYVKGARKDMIDEYLKSDKFKVPEIIPFDRELRSAYEVEDLIEWNERGYAIIILHNLQFYLYVMDKVSEYTNNLHPFFLEQIVGKERLTLMTAVDEIIKAYENGTTPMKVLKKYTPFLKTLAGRGHEKQTIKHNFFG